MTSPYQIQLEVWQRPQWMGLRSNPLGDQHSLQIGAGFHALQTDLRQLPGVIFSGISLTQIRHLQPQHLSLN